MKTIKRIISLALVVAVSLLCLCSCSLTGTGNLSDGNYIKVGDRKLSREYIGYFFYVAKRNMIKEAGFVVGDGGNASEEDISSFWETTEIEGKKAVDVARDLAADNAVIQTVQYLKAIEEGIKLTSDDEKEISDQITAATESSGGKEAFNNQLKSMGCDADAYRQILTENRYVQKLYDKYDSDGKLSVSDEELLAYSSAVPEGTPSEQIFDGAKKYKFNKMAQEWEKDYEIVISDKAMKEFDVKKD
jgi:hypothetical protein